MTAIIKTGSKQYFVKVGDIIDVELTEGAEVGKEIEFKEVLFLRNDNDIKLDSLAKAVVKGEVIDCIRGPKVIAYKYKKRKNYRRKVGHRQNYNRIKITQVV